jgi:mono/diheme cytochrome c family protein
MSRRTSNLVLLTLLVASVAAQAGLRIDAARPNLEFLPEMVRSVPADAFAANANFPDGKTLQAPPPGSIPRGIAPLRYAATPEDALRAGEELRNPFTARNTAASARGDVLFATYCRPCHGTAGAGDGPVVARGYPAPVSLLAEHAVNMKDGQMFHLLTYGQANMPSYAPQMSREDRWRVILKVRQLQSQAAAKPPAVAAPPAGAPAAN